MLLADVIEFTQNYLPVELLAVKNGAIGQVDSVLCMEKRAIIYKYTEDGYEPLNKSLRSNDGENITSFGQALETTLSKLPFYNGLVYRCVDLT